MEVIFSEVIGKFGLGGIAVAFVLALITGRLITVSWHRERVGDKDAQIAYLQQTLDKRDEQFERLLEGQQLTVRLLEDLKSQAHAAAGRSGGAG